MNAYKSKLAALSAALLAWGYCSPAAWAQSTATALFSPVSALATGYGLTPFPFDGFYSGANAPTLNVPGMSGAFAGINLQDGFSTTASFYADVSGELNYASAASHILIVNSATGAQLVPGVDFTVENEDAVAANPLTGATSPISAQRSRLLISPLRPLAPATRYLVALTQGMSTLQGGSVVASQLFAIASSSTPVAQQSNALVAELSASEKSTLEALRSQYIVPVLTQLTQFTGVPASQIVLAWSFTTESTQASLQAVAQNAVAGSIKVANTGFTTKSTGGYGFADLYAGTTTLPYYLQAPTTASPNGPLTGYWLADASKPAGGSFLGQVPCADYAERATVNGVALAPSTSTTACFPVPLVQSTQTVPVLVSVPDAKATGLTKPAAGWPVVIFQHGLGASREDLLYVADGLAEAGFVVVAIDLPLHGVTNTADPFYRNQLLASTAPTLETGERTFDLDYENNSTGAAGADGKPDASGVWFLNFYSLATTRDNIREAVADLATLSKSVGGLDLNGDGVADINTSKVYYFGHSMGAIVGATLLGVDSGIGAAVLANPGGGIAKLFDSSAYFSAGVADELISSGLARGTDAYETGLRLAQTVLDSADPVNYAAAARAGHAIDLIEVIGDTVVPNAVASTCPASLPAGIATAAALVAACPATASEGVTIQAGYLSGTDPLAQTLSLDSIGPIDVPVAQPDVVTGSNLGYVVQFAQGSHVTALNPSANPQETAEMQREAAWFLASGGQCLPVGGSCP